MTGAEAKRVLAILFAAYPVETRNVTREEVEATARAYQRGLDDLAENVVMKAIDRLIKTAERLPTVAALRKAALEVQHGRKRPGGDAWGDVVAAMKRFGYTRAPGIDFQFDDPLVARAVAAFGWQDLCGSHDSKPDRARFIELYDNLERDHRADAQLSSGARLVTPERVFARISEPKQLAELVQSRSHAVAVSTCEDHCPPTWQGHWRDYHRGHGCDQDPEVASR